MKLLFTILLIFACGAAVYGGENGRPKPDDVREFVADPIPSGGSDYFKDFKITQKDFDTILKDFVQVEEEHWTHGYSHVAFGDRTGHLILKDGREITWMVRPGGLAWLEFPTGKKIYLAGEKTRWPSSE